MSPWSKPSGTAEGRTTTEQRFYLLDQARLPTEVNALVRGHWGIENRAHCVHATIFHEDASRIRTGDALTEYGSAATGRSPGSRG
ncbi:MAG: hypothetical protein U0074_05180 [Kouleothrix sp.]